LTLALQLDALPERLECFDISHTLGEATVASCVVFDHDGAKNSAYRRFNIEGITAGDDYAAMRQALTRRYSKANDNFPDVLFIDGGRQQVNVAIDVLKKLAINSIKIVGVAKGSGRKTGLESLILPNEEKPLLLAKHAPALLLIQQIRDEAHRFAITAHRQRRAKARKMSRLEEIDGIGAKRRQLLLTHFGGVSNLARAAVEDIAKVPTISKALAQRIYDFFK
jgi:excinuclease ABC subunit C